jgi:hypothetical protein
MHKMRRQPTTSIYNSSVTGDSDDKTSDTNDND